MCSLGQPCSIHHPHRCQICFSLLTPPCRISVLQPTYYTLHSNFHHWVCTVSCPLIFFTSFSVLVTRSIFTAPTSTATQRITFHFHPIVYTLTVYHSFLTFFVIHTGHSPISLTCYLLDVRTFTSANDLVRSSSCCFLVMRLVLGSPSLFSSPFFLFLGF